jgi:aryl-alcohol dehydrogenase-like predicted oxidoreductase
MYRNRYWNPELFETVTKLAALAAEAGLTLVELAYRWLFSKPITGTILLGGSTPSQFEANLAYAELGALPDDVVASCDSIGSALFGPMPPYNR